jgi:hypothetical protein
MMSIHDGFVIRIFLLFVFIPGFYVILSETIEWVLLFGVAEYPSLLSAYVKYSVAVLSAKMYRSDGNARFERQSFFQ